LTLEIIPVIYTYWRNEELFWRSLAKAHAERLATLKITVTLLQVTLAVALGTLGARLYVAAPPRWLSLTPSFAAAAASLCIVFYLIQRRSARLLLSAPPASISPMTPPMKGEAR
jgi:hypothetical protein